MSVIEHIKEMISPGALENANAWAAQWFPDSQRAIASGVVQSVMSLAGGNPERLTSETRFVEDLALNELKRVQLVLDVERRFDLEIPDQDAHEIQTIGELVEWVHLHQQNTKPPGAAASP